MNRPRKKCISRSKKLRAIKQCLIKWREDFKTLDRRRANFVTNFAKMQIGREYAQKSHEYLTYYNKARQTVIYCSTKVADPENYCILCMDSVQVQEQIVNNLKHPDNTD